MSRKANPTLIGTFVLGALALAIVTILLLAGDQWFQKRQQYFMYFEEAGQGLQVGAPVVFLGVKVGTVKSIRIGMEEEKERFMVQVTIELDLQMIQSRNGGLIDRQDKFTIRHLVDKGLRGRLKMQSLLTGQLYVDLDFYPWKPAHFFNNATETNEIPTIPTTVEELAGMLENFPMSEFLDNLADIGEATQKILTSPSAQEIPNRLAVTLSHLQSLSAQLDAKGAPVISEMEKRLVELQKAVTAVQSAMDKVGKAADRVGELTDPDSRIYRGITQAGNELSDAAKALQLLADEESPTVQQFNKSLLEISRAAHALRLLAESLEQQPEAVLRGKSAVKENK